MLYYLTVVYCTIPRPKKVMKYEYSVCIVIIVCPVLVVSEGFHLSSGCCAETISLLG